MFGWLMKLRRNPVVNVIGQGLCFAAAGVAAANAAYLHNPQIAEVTSVIATACAYLGWAPPKHGAAPVVIDDRRAP